MKRGDESLTRVRKAFSLIELLTVIAIIAVLAALLFPVISSAKASSKKASALENVKQLALAHQMYSSEYDERLATSWLKEFPGDFSYFAQPYIKDFGVLFDPDKNVSPQSLATVCAHDEWGEWHFEPNGIDNPTNETRLWGFGFNTGYTWTNGTGLINKVANTANPGAEYAMEIRGVKIKAEVRSAVFVGVNMSEVTTPASTLMLGNTSGLPILNLMIDDLRPAGYPGNSDTPCEALARAGAPYHNGHNVYAYVDGHAESLAFNGTRAAPTSKITDLAGNLDPLALPNPCQLIRTFDGSNDPNGCREGFPHG